MANRREIENLQDLIKDTIGGEVVEQTVSSLLPPGENYGSVMYKVDFKVKKDGKEEEYHAVAKCPPINTVTQEIFNIKVTYKTEIGWYTTVIPTLKQFQRDNGVEKEIDFFQTFYGARTSLDPKSDKVDLDGVLLTQNLKYLGYYNMDRHVGFDLDTAYSILRDLATFHAVPLAIRLKNPELFNTKIKPNLPTFATQEEALIRGKKEEMLTVFSQIPECQPIMDRIRKSIEEGKLFEMPEERREPWLTVTHSDFWVNNIMVTGGKDSKTIILDLQFPCLSSPGADLAFFLFVSVNPDVVKHKIDDLIKYYHEEFCKNLQQLNVSTENYNLEGLLKEMEIEVRERVFVFALHHAYIILQEKGTTKFDSSDKNFSKESLVDLNIAANKRQTEKFKWIAFESAKRNWI